VPPSLKDMKKIRRQTVWHLLLRGHLPVEGFSSSELLLHLVQAVHRTNARLVGEIGFNTGLSSHAFLTANPDVHVVSFDLNKHGCVKVVKKLIDKKFPGRHTLIYGDLNRTGVSGHFTSFESESERHVIFASCEQLSARVA
jgi:tRNA G46 methylase TrmB